ncbi:MAG TPA: hypothetical protein VFA50_02425 [Stellaceae bacterium]|nr:hypothetical protein [Stellaceae bacterium]
MFHEYVTNSHGVQIDIGRAWFLMDKELLAQAEKWVDDNWQRLIDDLTAPNGQRVAPDRNQAIWGYYCSRHQEKYGRPFAPDIRKTPL